MLILRTSHFQGVLRIRPIVPTHGNTLLYYCSPRNFLRYKTLQFGLLKAKDVEEKKTNKQRTG